MQAKGQGGFCIKKKVIICIFILLNLPLVMLVRAEQCSEIMYYAKKEWVDSLNVFDVKFKEDEATVINTKSLMITQNVFGTIDTPKSIDSSAFEGASSYTMNSNGNKKNPNFFSLEFGKKIKVGKIQFKISATKKETGESIIKNVYVNGKPKFTNEGVFSISGKPVFSTVDNGLVTIDLNNQDVGDIQILFGINDDGVYTLEYFQILDYQILEATEWTREPIENTEVKKIRVCSGNGNYSPDGTSEWVKSSNTVFSPSVSLVSDYIPILDKQSVQYDWGRGSSATAYDTPNSVKEMGGVASRIQGWTRSGVKPTIMDKSYGSGLSEFPYILTEASKGVQFVAKPYYWSQTKQKDFVDISSPNRDWCLHVTGSSQIPCYKHKGHTSNARQNMFDVFIYDYKEVTDPSLRVLKSVDYYLVNEDTKQEEYLKSGLEEVQAFDFNTTGRWRIKSVLTDLANNVGEKKSRLFLVDKEIPNATFESDATENECKTIKLTPVDYHSGVSRWKYSVSDDGGNHFEADSEWLTSQSENILLSSTGDYIIRVDIEDKSGNSNTVFSNVYQVQVDTIKIDTILVQSYEKEVETTIFAKLSCKGCEENPKEFEVFVDKQLLFSKKLDKETNELYIPFVPKNEKETRIEFKYQQLLSALTVFEKTKEYKKTESTQLEFSGVVATGLDQNNRESYYKEYLLLNNHQDKNEVMSGGGVESAVVAQYSNECRIIENFACKKGVINKVGMLDSQLESGEAVIIFNEGASNVKEVYMMNGSYHVPLIFEESRFTLPRVYVNKKTGIVQLEDCGSSCIPGGSKWYTDPRGKLGSFGVTIMGDNIAHNDFKWKMKNSYRLTHHYYDDYKIHFADPSDPFKNGISKIWENQLTWFSELDLNSPLRQVELLN